MALKLNKGGSTSTRKIKRRIRDRADEILAVLFEQLHSRNPSVAIAAARTLLNKILADLKATELTGEEGKSIRVEIVDYGSKDKPTT